ncbi:MAG: hypothetical protein ACHQTE_02175 [Candidatus Saccharimonadales bacterium]
MKRIIILCSSLVVTLVVGTTVATVVRAEASAPMTEAHIAQIRTNCVEAQTSLNQLHASDALLRVNRGQLYESISTKLMAPLNSRLILNRLDGLKLVSITTDYDRQLADFRTIYQQYEQAMSRTLAFDCRNQPVAFYDSLTDTRARRQQTHEASVTLENTIQKYGTEFETFADNFKASTK